MDAVTLEKYRNQLLQQKQEILDLEKTLKESADTVVLDQTKVGRLSRMDALQGQQMALEQERRRKVQLQAIEGALNRMDAGDYGYCFVCDEEIPMPRLDVDPSQSRCIRCVEQ